MGGGPGWTVGRVSRSGDRWTGTLLSPSGERESSLQGRVINGEIAVKVQETIRADDDPKWLGSRTEFTLDDDGIMPALVDGVRPAVAMHSTNPTGATAPSRWEVIEVRDLDPADRDALLATPDPESEDPIRSLAGITGIVDKVHGQAIPVFDGRVQTEASASMPISVERKSSAWIQFAVGAGLAFIIVVLVIVKFNRN